MSPCVSQKNYSIGCFLSVGPEGMRMNPNGCSFGRMKFDCLSVLAGKAPEASRVVPAVSMYLTASYILHRCLPEIG